MDKTNKFMPYVDDPKFFDIISSTIEDKLSNLKKIVNKINEMRVEAAYMEADMVEIIDVKTWQDIAEFIGLAPMKMEN